MSADSNKCHSKYQVSGLEYIPTTLSKVSFPDVKTGWVTVFLYFLCLQFIPNEICKQNMNKEGRERNEPSWRHRFQSFRRSQTGTKNSEEVRFARRRATRQLLWGIVWTGVGYQNENQKEKKKSPQVNKMVNLELGWENTSEELVH